MTPWRPGTSLDTLKRRARLLQQVRDFFSLRGVLEVETPGISRFPTLDLHLESFSVFHPDKTLQGYLITSPEYHMKRLISAGSGSIYQLCRAYRCDESGSRHNPEFTILEWYRVGWDQWQLMKEIEDLMQLLLGTNTADYISYREAFEGALSMDPFTITLERFAEICSRHTLQPPDYLLLQDTDRDEWLNFLIGFLIEPHLGRDRPVFLHSFPASQASLAKLDDDNPQCAMRFEVYFKGLELGNGFCELTDAEAQENRFREENRKRRAAGKEELAYDPRFIEALKQGMPDCSGIAMGFDRLVMLALGKHSIDEVQTFTRDRS